MDIGTPLLQIDGLNVAYRVDGEALEALTDVSLTLHPGEIVGVVGESGSGKTTLGRTIPRLLPANGIITAGSVMFDNRDILNLASEQLQQVRGSSIGTIFQDPFTSLNPVFTIETQLIDAMKSHRRTSSVEVKDLKKQVYAALDSVGIPDPPRSAKMYPDQYSGGMLQRVLIALALLLEPRVLIADEPTASLDSTLTNGMLQLLKDLRDRLDTAILFISHDLTLISRFCNRVVVMYAGRVVESTDVSTAIANPRHPYLAALLEAVPSVDARGDRLATIPGSVNRLTQTEPGCKFARRCSVAQDVCVASEPQLQTVSNGSGAMVRCFIHDPESGYRVKRELPDTVSGVEPPVEAEAATDSSTSLNSDKLLEMRKVRTTYRTRPSIMQRFTGSQLDPEPVLMNIDLDVYRGETVGLVGISGSGKTTLAKTAMGLVKSDQGVVLFNGQDIDALDRRHLRELRRNVQLILQETHASLSPRHKVASLLKEPYRIHEVDLREQYAPADLLEMVSLSAEIERKYPHELSGGQARRIGIARALALRPALVIADEPTAGLDVSVAAGVLNLLVDLQKELGLTYLVISHDMTMVGHLADRIAVMNRGRIVEIGRTEEVLDSPVSPHTKDLLAAASLGVGEGGKPGSGRLLRARPLRLDEH